jgi:hypothetical protein
MSNQGTTTPATVIAYAECTRSEGQWDLPTSHGPELVRMSPLAFWVVSGHGLGQSSWNVHGDTLFYSTPEAAQAAYDERHERLMNLYPRLGEVS